MLLLTCIKVSKILDLSVTSDLLHEGRFLQPDIEDKLLRQAAESASPSGCVATRWGEARFLLCPLLRRHPAYVILARLTRTLLHSPSAPSTVALAVDVFLPSSSPLAAPFDVEVLQAEGQRLVTSSPSGVHLIIDGLPSLPPLGAKFSAGQLILSLPPSSRIRVQLCLDSSLRPPAFSTVAFYALLFSSISLFFQSPLS